MFLRKENNPIKIIVSQYDKKFLCRRNEEFCKYAFVGKLYYKERSNVLKKRKNYN